MKRLIQRHQCLRGPCRYKKGRILYLTQTFTNEGLRGSQDPPPLSSTKTMGFDSGIVARALCAKHFSQNSANIVALVEPLLLHRTRMSGDKRSKDSCARDVGATRPTPYLAEPQGRKLVIVMCSQGTVGWAAHARAACACVTSPRDT